MPQIPMLPLKTIVLFHLGLFAAAMWVSPLSASWLWTNVLVILLLLRLLEMPVTAESSAPIAEVSVCLYILTILNDIICFSISQSGTSGQTFSLTMACFSMAAKPFFGSLPARLQASIQPCSRPSSTARQRSLTGCSFVSCSAFTSTGHEEPRRRSRWVHGWGAWWTRRGTVRVHSAGRRGRTTSLWISIHGSWQHHGLT